MISPLFPGESTGKTEETGHTKDSPRTPLQWSGVVARVNEEGVMGWQGGQGGWGGGSRPRLRFAYLSLPARPIDELFLCGPAEEVSMFVYCEGVCWGVPGVR